MPLQLQIQSHLGLDFILEVGLKIYHSIALSKMSKLPG